MIKLSRPSSPAVLTSKLVADLTAKYMADKSSVWDIKEVRDALRAMTHDKCSYCESQISSRNAPAEIDHFFCKKFHEPRVMEWDNFLPCCKGCNVRKGHHDVAVEAIINPCNEHPKNHIRIRNFFYHAKTNLGNSTLGVLDFNVDQRLMRARFNIGLEIENKLAELVEKIAHIPPDGGKLLSRLRNRTAALISDLPKQPHAATISTLLVQSGNFSLLSDYLKKMGEWTEELAAAEKEIHDISLP